MAQGQLQNYLTKRMMMKKTLTLIYGISLAVIVSSPARADEARTGQLASPDKKFVENAVEGGKMEVQLGQLATQKGATQSVRDFGVRMTQDHQTANNELEKILDEKGITEPASTTQTASMADDLQNRNGADFDRAYMADMVKDHQEDIASFKNEAANGKDAQIRSWAARTLPTLENHLQTAEQTESGLPK
jgi:putative membrane protein